MQLHLTKKDDTKIVGEIHDNNKNKGLPRVSLKSTSWQQQVPTIARRDPESSVGPHSDLQMSS
jgi:hypothetical protein